MELTWAAIAASICMGLAGVCVFVAAVQRNWFHDLEDAKYQVFWSDIENLVNQSHQEAKSESDSETGKD